MKYVFVSSTFRDMQAERDALHSVVMPRLSHLAKQKGDDIYFRDLRWGVNTSAMDAQSANEKVLFSCMNEIDRCKPFILVLLGERYGTSFDLDFIRKVAQRKDYELLPRSSERESVTELEIEYGSLSDPEALRHTVFMFRDPIIGAPDDYKANGETDEEREESSRMLAELKEKIKAMASENGIKVVNYSLGWDEKKGKITGIENFIEAVTREMTALLEPLWNDMSELSPVKAEHLAHKQALKAYAKQCVGRLDLMSECVSKLEKGNVALKITGEEGGGKSVLTSRIAWEMRAKGWNVYPFIYRSSSSSLTGVDMLRQWVWYIEELLGLDATEEPSYTNQYDRYEYYEERLYELLEIYDNEADKPLLLVSDAWFEEAFWDYNDLSSHKSKKVSFIFSYRKDSDENHLHYKPAKDHIFLGNYPLSGRVLLESTMKELGKELHPTVTRKILQKYDSANPVYLALLIQRLLIMDANDFRFGSTDDKEFDPSVSAQLHLLDSIPQSLPEMIRAVVAEAAERFGREQTEATVRLLAYAKTGLRRSDISRIIQNAVGMWDEESFSRLINLLPSVFTEHYDDTVNFKNQKAREAVASDAPKDRNTVEKSLSHFEELPWDDPVKREQIFRFYMYLFDCEIGAECLNEAHLLLLRVLENWKTHSVDFSFADHLEILEKIFEGFVLLWRKLKCVSQADLSELEKACSYVESNSDLGYLQSYEATFSHLLDTIAKILRETKGAPEILEPYFDKYFGGFSAREYNAYNSWIRCVTLAELYEQSGEHKRAEEFLRSADKHRLRYYKKQRDYIWFRCRCENTRAKIFDGLGKKHNARRSFRRAMKICKRRIEYSPEKKQLRWRNFCDTIPRVFEWLGWSGTLGYGGATRLDDENLYTLREYIIEDLNIARIYEKNHKTAIALSFYQSAVQKAERALDQQDEETYDFDLWILAMSLQSYASYCVKLTEDRDDFDNRIIGYYSRALEILRKLSDGYDNADMKDTIAVIMYSLATLPRAVTDRGQLLSEAKSLAKELREKTGLFRYKLMAFDIARAEKRWVK